MGLKVFLGVSLAVLTALLSGVVSFDLFQVVEALSGMSCTADGVCQLLLNP